MLGLFLLSLLFLSFSGADWKAYCNDKGINRWILPLFLLIDGNSFNDLYSYEAVRVGKYMLIVSGITYIAGIILFTGMLISVITNVISQRVDNYQNGLTHYLKSGHYVIMGYDDMVPSIIDEIFQKDKHAYVLILTAFDASKIKEWLKKTVAKNQLDRIIVNYGQRTAMEYYDDIHLETAKEIYIVGNRTRSSHDAVNIECVDSICTYLQEHSSSLLPKRITCVFEDIDTYAAFKTTEIFEEVRKLKIEFIPYNFYSGWARQVFFSRSYREKRAPEKSIPYPSVYGEGIGPDDRKFVHLVFVGTSNLAVSFATEAAHMLHFPNFRHDNALRTRVTFIELNADKEMNLFRTRNRHLFQIQDPIYRDLTKNEDMNSRLSLKKDNFLDVEYEFIKGDVFSEEAQNLIKEWADDKEHQYLSIFLTMTDQRSNFMMAMNLPDEVYDNAIPVFIRQDRADNFVTNLRRADSKDFVHSQVIDGNVESIVRKGRYANLYPFGMEDMAYCGNDQDLKRAKLLNYLYNHISDNHFPDVQALDAIPVETLWADAEDDWKDLSLANQWSSLYSIYSIPCKLASLRHMRGLKSDDTSHDLDQLTEEEVLELGIAEHNRWNVEKLLMGFRKVKPEEDKYIQKALTKDLVKGNKKLFIHHDIRPFDELDEVKQLDFEVVKYMPWILKMTGQ